MSSEMNKPFNGTYRFVDSVIENKRGKHGSVYFCEYIGFRCPKAGEYYLSGAIVEGYRAGCDMTSEYHIIKPTHLAEQRMVWQKTDRITR